MTKGGRDTLHLHRKIACSAASSVGMKQAADPGMPAEREMPGGVKEGKLFQPSPEQHLPVQGIQTACKSY